MPAKIIFIIFFLIYCAHSAQIIDSVQKISPVETTVTVQSILENYINAVGGRENLSEIIDKRTAGLFFEFAAQIAGINIKFISDHILRQLTIVKIIF